MSLMRSVKTVYSEVSDGAASVTIVSSDPARCGVSIWNDSASILYLLVGGGTASATECSVKVPADGYWESPYGYGGTITGVWSADAAGQARITSYF